MEEKKYIKKLIKYKIPFNNNLYDSYSSYSSYSSFSSFSSFYTSYGSFYTSFYSSYGSYFTSGNVMHFWIKEFMVKHILAYERYLEIIRKIKRENLSFEMTPKIINQDISNQIKYYKNSNKKVNRDIYNGTLSYGFFSLGYGIELI